MISIQSSALVRITSLTLFALFCATSTYWFITLNSHHTTPLPAASASRAPVKVDYANQLFGGQANSVHSDFQLTGVLALQEGGAAAIIGQAGKPLRAISVGQPIDQNTRLNEVRARSVIIEQSGIKSEVFLPAATESPTIYVR